MTQTTKTCKCGGTMTHSDDMENPFAGDADKTPFWQCEMCGATTNDFITLPSELYYTQADEMGCTFVGTKQECIAAIRNVFPDKNAKKLFAKYFSDDWNQFYPLVCDGALVTDTIVGADEADYVVEPNGMYVMPESEALALGYDAENQSW